MSNSIDFAEAILDFKSRNAEELKRDAAEIRQRIFGIRDAMKDVDKQSQAFANLSGQLRQASREAFVLREALAARPSGGSMLGDVGKMASAIGAATLATKALNASWDMVIGTIGKGIKLSAELERAKVSMGFSLKSPAAGDRVVSEMRNLAIDNPLLNSQQTIGLANQFITRGLVTSMDDLKSKITALGDVASTAGSVSQEEAMSRIMRQIMQIAGKPKLMQQDLNVIAETGIAANPKDIFARGLGMSVEDMDKANKAGKITGKQFAEAFFRGATEMFGGAAQARANTLEGTWARLSEQWDVSTQKIGEQFVEPLKRIMNQLITMGDDGSLQGAAKTIAESAEGMISTLLTIPKAFKESQDQMRRMINAPINAFFGEGEAIGDNPQGGAGKAGKGGSWLRWGIESIIPGLSLPNEFDGRDPNFGKGPKWAAPAAQEQAAARAKKIAEDNANAERALDPMVRAAKGGLNAVVAEFFKGEAGQRIAKEAEMGKNFRQLWGAKDKAMGGLGDMAMNAGGDMIDWLMGTKDPTKDKLARVNKQIDALGKEKPFEFRAESAEQMWQRIQQDIFKKPDDQKQILMDQKKALEDQLKLEKEANDELRNIGRDIKKIVDNFPKGMGWA